MTVLTEKQFQTQVEGYCRQIGAPYYHTQDSRRSVAGFPDLCIISRRRGVLFRELKTDLGTLSRQQQQWITDLQRAGADAAVWRPRDRADILLQLTS